MTAAQIVILAGGQGTRFWPVSRKNMPKQFLSIDASGRSLIQVTADRMAAFASPADIMVVTNTAHTGLVAKHLPEARVVQEPLARNTAPAIGLAAMLLARENPEAVMVVLPADHVVSEQKAFETVLEAGIQHAAQGEHLVTIGIAPHYAHTGYGYIQSGSPVQGLVKEVKAFHEKPERAKAESYVAAGNYYWNSGMFIWRVDTILAALEQHLPELHKSLQVFRDAPEGDDMQTLIDKVFPTLPKESIDVGVMEKAENCVMVEAAAIGWSDVGSWEAWAEHMPQDASDNVLQTRDPILVDSHSNVIVAEDKTVACVGVSNLIVIDTGDALLVCARDEAQQVKQVVEVLQSRGKDELL